MPGETRLGPDVSFAVMVGDLDPAELHRPPTLDRPRARTIEAGQESKQERDDPNRKAEPVPHIL